MYSDGLYVYRYLYNGGDQSHPGFLPPDNYCLGKNEPGDNKECINKKDVGTFLEIRVK